MLIIFDLDDTIIDTSGSILPAQLKIALSSMVEVGLPVKDFDQAFERLREIDAKAESSRASLKSFLEPYGLDPFFTVGEQKIYEDMTFEQPVLTTKNAKKTLAALYNNYILALVSIGEPNIQLLKMEKAGIDTGLFSRIEICKGEGKSKSYASILEQFNLPCSSVVVVGDRIKRDLLPGKRLGFKTVHIKWGRGLYQTAQADEVDFTISSLDEIEPILEDIKHSLIKENLR